MELIANGGAYPGSAPDDAATPACRALALLTDQLAYGVLVATIHGRVLHVNQAGRHELAHKRVLALHHGTVCAHTSRDANLMREALAAAAQGKRSLLALRGTEDAEVTLVVLPLPAGPGQPPHVALLFARATVCEEPMLALFARRHGLTATEEQVLAILCQGSSAPQAAAQMEVAVSTIRSHVRSLCAKTRCRSVRELVNRVAVLPAVAPATSGLSAFH